jgi:hypothetical protein
VVGGEGGVAKVSGDVGMNALGSVVYTAKNMGLLEARVSRRGECIQPMHQSFKFVTS